MSIYARAHEKQKAYVAALEAARKAQQEYQQELSKLIHLDYEHSKKHGFPTPPLLGTNWAAVQTEMDRCRSLNLWASSQPFPDPPLPPKERKSYTQTVYYD